MAQTRCTDRASRRCTKCGISCMLPRRSHLRMRIRKCTVRRSACAVIRWTERRPPSTSTSLRSAMRQQSVDPTVRGQSFIQDYIVGGFVNDSAFLQFQVV